MRRRLLRYLALGVLLLIPLLPLWLVATTSGLNQAIQFAQARLPLVAENPEGSLWRGVSLDALRYQGDGLDLTIKNVNLRVRWLCMLRSTLCIDEASAGSVKLVIEERESEDAVSLKAPLPWLPFLLDINSLAVQELRIVRGDNEELVRKLTLSGEVGKRQALVAQLAGEHAMVAWDGGGTLSRKGAWDLALEVSLRSAALSGWPENLTTDYAISGTGDLDSLEGTVSALDDSLSLALALDRGLDGRVDLVGSLDGAAILLPQLPAYPDIGLEGPLAFEAQLADLQNLRASFRQQVVGLTPRAASLGVSLEQSAGFWTLEEAVLGDDPEPLLRVAGALGELSYLSPVLSFEANNFRVPLRPDQPRIVLSGSGQGRFTLSDPLGSFALSTLSMTVLEGETLWSVAGDLQASDFPLLPAGKLRGRRGELPFSYERSASPGAAATLDLPEGLPGEELRVSALQARLTPGDVAQLDLNAEGDLRGDLDIALQRSSSGVEFEIQPFVLYLRDEAILANAPLVGAWHSEDAAIALEAFCLQWRANTACSENASLGQQGELNVSVQIDEELQGAISEKPFSLEARGAGATKIVWGDGALEEAVFDLAFDRLSIDPYMYEGTANPIEWEEARAFGTLRPDLRELTLDLQSARLGAVYLTLNEAGADLNGTLRTRGLDLASLDDLLPEWSLRSGSIEADMSIKGSRGDPQLFGKLLLQNAAARHPDIDTTLSDLRLALDARGDAFSIDGSALLGGAPLTLAGNCCDDGTLEAVLKGEKNELLLPTLGVEALLSPQLNLRLNRESVHVGGEVTVHRGVFEHAGPADEAIEVSEDFYRIDIPQAPARRFDVTVDLRALIEPGFTLRSKELEATLSGDLKVNIQPRLPPALYGDLQVLGGELRAYGQVLRLTEGSVGFVGDPVNPALNLSAERRIRAEDLRVGFHVRGSLEEPTFEMFSDPVRSERDTLSYLLRGRGPDAGASMDGTAMALSLGASAINQSGALESLNSIPGLSGVSLGAEGSDDDMAATISAYVGERLYLSYGVGIYEPVNALTARLYLRSRLWLEVVSRLESSFDLYYRFDIE
ncbi:translocation/assembly module TamB domain-containing protein [Congregibacter litoralis]|uniref:Autotransporter secretion inner membrane protein TamB n=1 Tax=Congregibacter litoralis KT71 TaxID=314285 RepID=A4A832_9GAMM|nr:translocation/assembly module TamB domain-containing protein [Congregibacter litoralis]EAQ97827.2 autotransporter secretion inner membrane protein TamB [Congregibacter litoralis KT71]